jgi:hypothetical protein
MTIPRKYPDYEYTDIIFEIKGKIGIIKVWEAQISPA